MKISSFAIGHFAAVIAVSTDDSLPPCRDNWELVTQIPALVSQEQFDLVQGKLAHNQQFARRNNTAHSYLLRALVSCGLCHLACTGRCDARHNYTYYTCRGKSHPIVSCRDEKCPSRYIPAQQLSDHQNNCQNSTRIMGLPRLW